MKPAPTMTYTFCPPLSLHDALPIYASLRWQVLALSRSYRAVLGGLTGPARAALLSQQRDWVSELDRRCVGDRSSAELSTPSSALHDQADRKSTRLNSSH